MKKEDEMKKLLALMIVLAMAGMANAALMISVDGVVDPQDTDIEIYPSDEVIIDVHALAHEGYFGGVLFVNGPATLVGAGGTLWGDGAIRDIIQPELQDWIDGMAGMGYPGITSVVEFQLVDLVDPYDPIPDGLVMDGIVLHCLAEGDVIVGLMDGDDFAILDEVVIHQIPIPEPMTIALLGLGGLLLRRRK